MKQSTIFANSSLTDAWLLFELHELSEIVRQNGDPEFATLLNKMREDNHTSEDIQFIKSLSETETTNWPADSCKLVNEKHLNEFQREVRTLHTIYANDAKRDVKTNLQKITIEQDVNPLSAKLTKWPNILKQFVGNLPTNCLSMFVHFQGLALKGLILATLGIYHIA